MANWYNSGIQKCLDGTIQWGTSDMRMILVKSSYTFDDEHDDLADGPAGNEISQGGRATLDGEVVTLDDTNNGAYCDATDETFSSLAAGDTPSQFCVYLYNASDASAQLMCRNALTTPPAPNGGNYTIVFASGGIAYMRNA